MKQSVYHGRFSKFIEVYYMRNSDNSLLYRRWVQNKKMYAGIGVFRNINMYSYHGSIIQSAPAYDTLRTLSDVFDFNVL